MGVKTLNIKWWAMLFQSVIKLSRMRHLYALVLAVSVSGALFSEVSYANPADDPWYELNQKIHRFNETMDRIAARPVARAYRYGVPRFVRSGIGNFFNNLGEVPTAVNSLLQAKPARALNASGRLIINTSFGLLGIMDVASQLGLDEHDEDFGQTLAVWGVGSGPYVVLPVLGPSTLRDALSIYPNYRMSPIKYFPMEEHDSYGVLALDLIHRRHNLLSQEGLINGDKYIFYRDAYLQNRDYEIRDGLVEDAFDAGFDDFELEEDF